MTVNFELDEKAFLTYLLYDASRSERIKKKRLKNRWLVPAIYIVLAVWAFTSFRSNTAFFLIIVAVLWVFLYPLWERWYYKKHYQGFIKEKYKKHLGRTTTFDISNDIIVAKEDGIESKVMTTEIEGIYEIPSIIAIRLNNGQSFLLPKDKITDIDALKAELQQLAKHLQIDYHVDDKWEWR